MLERAKRARGECGLHRWVAEPGVDRWEGTFPSLDAARAWAAIDALARRYVADGTGTHVEAARGRALTDLVAGQATIEAVLTLTVPAAAVSTGTVGRRAVADDCAALAERAADDLAEAIGPAGNGGRPSRVATVEVAPCHPDTGALVDPASLSAQDPRLEQKASLTQDQAIGQDATHGEAPESDAEARNDAVEPNRTDPGADAPSGAVQQNRTDTGADTPNQAVQPNRTDTVRTGGASTLQQIAAGFGSGAYRPSARMAKRVKARDRRCRFPGWSVTSAADGTVTWTDPTGRVRTTSPADALTCTVLGGAATPAAAAPSTSVTLTALPDGPHSHLEFLLEHHAATVPSRCRASTTRRDHHGRRHRVELQPVVGTVLADDGWPHHPNRGHRQLARQIRRRDDDPPPF